MGLSDLKDASAKRSPDPLEASFVDVVAGASLASFGVCGTPKETRDIAAWCDQFSQVWRLREVDQERGWADEERLAAIAEALKAWGERPDAFMAVTSVTAVGRVDERS